MISNYWIRKIVIVIVNSLYLLSVSREGKAGFKSLRMINPSSSAEAVVMFLVPITDS